LRTAAFIACFIGQLALTAGSASATPTQTIPFEINEAGHMIVKVSINRSGPSEAVIDTGATYPIIDHRTATLAGIPPPNGLEQIDILGLGGIQTFPVVQVPYIGLGEIELSDTNAAYNSRFRLPGAHNVLPALSLPHRVLDFDFKTGRLTAYDRAPRDVENSVTSQLDMQQINRLPFIEIEINGISGRALIDTGASISFVNSTYAKAAEGKKGSIREVQLIGSTGETAGYRILTSRRVRFGNFKIDRLEAFVADPEILADHGLAGEPIMVLGLDILSEFRLQIDRADGRVLLSQGAKGIQLKPL
jgi:predicted aspartyl protease